MAFAQLTVVVSIDPDKDKDGLYDYDASSRILDVCPDVFGPTSNK
jgi:hypothetical protein